MESNEGNLVADALLFQATALAASFGAPIPHVALQNGGAIRNDTIIPAGDITRHPASRGWNAESPSNWCRGQADSGSVVVRGIKLQHEAMSRPLGESPALSQV
jgi:hypothetical protein